MAFEYDGKIYRNLEEQVDYNKDCINDLDLRVDTLEKHKTTISDLDLNVGIIDLIYDTTDGISLTTQGTIKSNEGTDTVVVDYNIPVVGVDGITIDKADNAEKIEISGKDCVRAINAQEGQSILYLATNGNPNDAVFMSLTKTGYTVPRRYAGGQIEVGDPEGDSDAVPKKYAENNFVKAIIVTDGTYCYAANSSGPNQRLGVDINAGEYSLAERYDAGRLKVGTPVNDADAINKKYAEDNFIPLKQISSGAFIVPQIGYNKEIYWLGSDVNLTGSSLAKRTSEGRLRATDPVDQYDLVNLQYLNANALTADNVKTLFGNQSIIGSGNIDLYNHDIEITGQNYGTPISIEFNRVSSKNLVVNSINDLITLLGNEFRISVSGYDGEGGITSETVRNIHMLSTTDGGGYLSYHIGSENYAVADITNLTITDTVTTV